MKSDRNLFFTEIGFCEPRDIKGLDLNFSLYLLGFLKGAKLSNNSLILYKKNLSGVVNILFFNCQCFIPNCWVGKIIKNKIFMIKVKPISLINIGPVGRGFRETRGTIRN